MITSYALARPFLLLLFFSSANYTTNVAEHNKPEYDVGDMAKLSCAIPEQYWSWKDEVNVLTDCKFVDPNGETYYVGISGEGGYGEDARVDCLCDVSRFLKIKKKCFL